MHEIQIWGDGPMHPDLFDGETPIRQPVTLRLYEVDVEYVIEEQGLVTVLARDETEARRGAVRAAKEAFGPFDRLAHVGEPRASSKEVAPTDVVHYESMTGPVHAADASTAELLERLGRRAGGPTGGDAALEAA